MRTYFSNLPNGVRGKEEEEKKIEETKGPP